MVAKKLREHMSKIAKKGHKKNPRPRSYYVEIGKKGALKRWKNV